MLTTLATLLAVTSALATTPESVLYEVANQLEVEAALQAREAPAETAAVIFGFREDYIPELRFDIRRGDRGLSNEAQSTVGFAQLGEDMQTVTAVYRRASSDHLCSRVSAEFAASASEQLVVYDYLDDDPAQDHKAQIVYGKDREGEGLMAVWIRPGEQVTTVTAVDSRSGKRATRTELRRRSRTLVVSGDDSRATACIDENE